MSTSVKSKAVERSQLTDNHHSGDEKVILLMLLHDKF